MANPTESDLFSKMNSTQMPQGMNPFFLGLNKQLPPFSFDWMSKISQISTGVNQNVSPASGAGNLFRDKLPFPIPPFFSMFNRPSNINDSEQASLLERSKNILMMPPFDTLSKNKTS